MNNVRWVVERRIPVTSAHERNHDFIENGLAHVMYGPFMNRDEAAAYAIMHTHSSELPFKLFCMRQLAG